MLLSGHALRLTDGHRHIGDAVNARCTSPSTAVHVTVGHRARASYRGSGGSPHAGDQAVARVLRELAIAGEFGLQGVILFPGADHEQHAGDPGGDQRPP